MKTVVFVDELLLVNFAAAAALLLGVLVAIAKPQASQSAQVMDSLGANRPASDLKTA